MLEEAAIWVFSRVDYALLSATDDLFGGSKVQVRVFPKFYSLEPAAQHDHIEPVRVFFNLRPNFREEALPDAQTEPRKRPTPYCGSALISIHRSALTRLSITSSSVFVDDCPPWLSQDGPACWRARGFRLNRRKALPAYRGGDWKCARPGET